MTISLTSSALASAGFSHGFSTRDVDLRFDAPDYAGHLRRFARASGIETALSPRKAPADAVDPPGAPSQADLPFFGIAQARQVHGAQVVDAKTMWPLLDEWGNTRDRTASAPSSGSLRETSWLHQANRLPEADAIVAEPGYAAGVRVADCVPILVGDPESGAVVAIHAGWRGTVAGVIQRALERLVRTSASGSTPLHAVAAIGPCICAACFEVDRDVGAQIASAAGDATVTFSGAKAHADLRLAARHLLEGAGLRLIDDVPGCTRCEPERFFSYRRGRDAGRHLAAIAARSLL